MRAFLPLMLAGSALLAIPPVWAGHRLYGQAIVIPTNAPGQRREAATELACWLSEMTGQPFAITSRIAQGGITLLTADDPATPAKVRAALTASGSREAYWLRADPHACVIVGATESGLQHGVYAYLDRLGCRWFFPNDHWTIVPRRQDIRLRGEKTDAPRFRMRAFFGTGGFGGTLPTDPEMALQKRWEDWMRRNRLGGEIKLAGHAGEEFNSLYRAELEAHPEYLAELNGKRQAWSVSVKPCYSNPGLRRLFVADRLKKYRTLRTNYAGQPVAFAVSVEPADGGGHCECAECRKLGSVSDRVFSLANEVARAVRKEFPDGKVSLFAYNEHGAVPSIPIESNVFVTVIPYGFNQTGLSGDELLEAWGRKHPGLALYDYWAIPDWAYDKPTLSVSGTVPAKLRHWARAGVIGFLGESTYSAGAVGLAWYLAARLMWNPDADAAQIQDEFYRLCFPKAQTPMRRMRERWDREFLLTEYELGLSYRDWHEAWALADTPEERARIADMGLYLHYLREWCEYEPLPRGTPESEAKAGELLRYLWRIHGSGMVHSYRLSQLVLRHFKTNAVFRAAWDTQNSSAAGWRDIAPPDEDEIVELMRDGAARYPVLDLGVRSFSTKWVPLKPSEESLSTNTVWSPQFLNETEFAVWAPAGLDCLTLGLELKTYHRSFSWTKMEWRDAGGELLCQTNLPLDADRLTLPLHGPGLYRLKLGPGYSYRLRVPENLPLVATSPFVTLVSCPRVYFFVPDGTRVVAMAIFTRGPVFVFDGDGRDAPTRGKRLMLVDVPEGQAGRLWSLEGSMDQPVRLLNVPQGFAFAPAGAMVPADLNL